MKKYRHNLSVFGLMDDETVEEKAEREEEEREEAELD